MTFLWPDGATPLTTEESRGLIPRDVTTRAALDAAEQANILRAHDWLATRRPRDVLNESFLFELHRHMFDAVWKWAGEVRHSDKNIGVRFPEVRIALRELLLNAKAWVENGSYVWDEIGARFHHQLVAIHCFPNGNGRHARLATDVLLSKHGQLPFSWAAGGKQDSLNVPSDVRRSYIAALRAANGHDYGPLLLFVRS